MPRRLLLSLAPLLACAGCGGSGGGRGDAAGGTARLREAAGRTSAEAEGPAGAEAQADEAAGPATADAAAEGLAANEDAGAAQLPQPSVPEPALPRPGRPPLAAPDLGPPVAGGIAAIPAGTFLRGSWPGPNGRDPRKEVDLVPTSVAAFEIDRLPYPDDPAREPLVNVTLHEAAARCATDGRRLCTEVEWEYACKGPQNQTYPYGDDYGDGRYADPSAVVSSFGVLQMTVRYEWTAGDWVDAKGATVGNVAPLRGAHPTDGAAAERRCANRTGLDPTRGSPRIGFRCCRGAGFPGAYEMEPTRRAFRPGPLMSDPAFARLVRSIPELARVHDDPRLQGDGVVTQAMLRSSLAEASGMGYSISVQPVLWIPVPGEELLGIVGRCGRDLFAATLYTTGVPGLYAHAASLVLTDVPDDEGIALFGGFRDRKLLGWGECDDCREGGSFEYHEEDGTITPGHRW